MTALKVIYAGLRDAKGQLVHPGYLPGAEEEMGGFGGWDAWIMGPAPEKSTLSFFANGFFSDMVFEKTDWDVKTFNVDRDLPIACQKTAAAIDAVNPNLSAFRSHGGKLILYHGWNDPAIPALNTVNYYEEVIGSMGRANADSFVRLYMVPDMQYCFGGPGADEFGGAGSFTWTSDPQRNARTALENWVEKGTAPGVIIASKIEGAAPATVGPGPCARIRNRRTTRAAAIQIVTRISPVRRRRNSLGRSRVDCRQPFPCRVMEGLPVTRAQPRDAPLIGYQGQRFCMRSTLHAMNDGFNLRPECLLG